MQFWNYLTDEHSLAMLFESLPIGIIFIIIAVTIYLLTKGADWIIDGSVNLALRTRLPKFVIGATILSLGTTAPEAFVSVMAAFTGNPGLALGNGVGSIIVDTGLIFGLVVLIAAPPHNKRLLNRTGWWQLGSAILLVLLAVIAKLITNETPFISRWMGLILVSFLGVYLWLSYRWAQSGGQLDDEDNQEEKVSLVLTFILFLGGLFFVLLASRILIPAASETARRLKVPEDVIAATMVALGTSLPELTTAIAAIKKGHPEITIGNIAGADVLNALFVIGAASLAAPLAVPPNFLRLHFPVMLIILISFKLFTDLNKTGRFKRWQGVYLTGIYIMYITFQYIKL